MAVRVLGSDHSSSSVLPNIDMTVVGINAEKAPLTTICTASRAPNLYEYLLADSLQDYSPHSFAQSTFVAATPADCA